MTMVRCIGAGLLDEESMLILIFHAIPVSSYSCLFLLLMWLWWRVGWAQVMIDREAQTLTYLQSLHVTCSMGSGTDQGKAGN